MESKTKLILGIGIAVLLIGGGIGAYFYFRTPPTTTKKDDSKTPPKAKQVSSANAKQAASLNAQIATIDTQLNNPRLLDFLDESDAAALQQQKDKLQSQLNILT